MAHSDPDEREEELSAITAIFPELVLSDKTPFDASIDIPVALPAPLAVVFPPPAADRPPHDIPTPPLSVHDEKSSLDAAPVAVLVRREVHRLSYLPPLHLEISLPDGYPTEKAPRFTLSTLPEWLPQERLHNLESEGDALWEEYGRGQVVFAYIDFLQQAAERAFDLAEEHEGVLEIRQEMKDALLGFDIKARRERFEQETFDCGVCLEPKKGSVCYRLLRCGHVFCVPCLQDFYNNCIKEGDVAGVRCLDPDCGAEKQEGNARRKKKTATLSPAELLAIPLDRSTVLRYVELKRKKKIESDKTTVYCPRKWCQGPARSKRYPKTTDLDNLPAFMESDDSDTEDPPEVNKQPSEIERVAVCEECNYAFCRVCLCGWHGEYVRCWPRTATEMSAEEQASFDYIRMHTSPCPTCSAPCQKTHGCNHMSCFQCRTHFCYLCGAWLDPGNPYQHFNQKDRGCYMRLWELEEGDNGDGEVQFGGARGWEAAANAEAIAQAQQELAAAAAVEEDGHGHGGHAAAAPQQPAQPHQQQQQQQQAAHPRDRAVGARPAAPAGQGHAPPAHPPADAAANPAGLQRFLQMVRDDEEDEWDSDELDEGGDAAWVIPDR